MGVVRILPLGCEQGSPHRSAKPPTPKSARESARGGAGQKRGARGSARKSACPWCLYNIRKGGQALFRALPRAPSFWPAPPRALSRALLGGWGFCTSVGGPHVRNLSHTTPQKMPRDEEGLLWGWCVVRGPLIRRSVQKIARMCRKQQRVVCLLRFVPSA